MFWEQEKDSINFCFGGHPSNTKAMMKLIAKVLKEECGAVPETVNIDELLMMLEENVKLGYLLTIWEQLQIGNSCKVHTLTKNMTQFVLTWKNGEQESATLHALVLGLAHQQGWTLPGCMGDWVSTMWWGEALCNSGTSGSANHARALVARWPDLIQMAVPVPFTNMPSYHSIENIADLELTVTARPMDNWETWVEMASIMMNFFLASMGKYSIKVN